MDRAQAKRFEEAWKRYVRRELALHPDLAEVKQEVLAERIAKRLGDTFTAQTFSKIKSGRQEPKGRQLLAIAAEMGEDAAALAGLAEHARDNGFPARDDPPRVEVEGKPTKKQTRG